MTEWRIRICYPKRKCLTMKDKVNYSGLIIITAIITVIMTFTAIEFFLKSNLFDIHRGTQEGALSNIGVLVIIVVASALSVTAMLLIKRHKAK